MSANSYFTIPGGHPPQTELLTGRAVFTQAYAVIPKGVMRDIVTSNRPSGTRPAPGLSPAPCRVSPRPSRNM